MFSPYEDSYTSQGLARGSVAERTGKECFSAPRLGGTFGLLDSERVLGSLHCLENYKEG